jgi:serine phosphatase RsbU (regulator of sigma subunit)
MLAHEWLQGSPLVVMKNDVDRVDEPGAEALSDLMSEFDCDIMFPLSYHGRPLGLALVQGETKSDPSLHFYGSLNRHLASGLAFALLNEREHGMDGQSEVLVQAKDTQRSLMPAENVVRRQHFELRGVFRPADECGGDLWVWKELPDNKLLIVIADATGHGAGPALISSVAKGAIDAYLHESMRDASPDKLLSALNRAIYRVGRRFFMMTAFATVVDLNNGNMVYANAAQTFPYVFSDGKVGALVARGNSLGAAMDVEFTLYERTLSKGDQMLFVTDGVVEAGAAVDKEFGERRFRSLLAQLRGTRAVKMPDVVLSTVRQHLGKSPVGDDITIVAFSYGQVGDVGKALQT